MPPSEIMCLLSREDLWKTVLLFLKSHHRVSICSFTHHVHAGHRCVSGTVLGSGDKVITTQAEFLLLGATPSCPSCLHCE